MTRILIADDHPIMLSGLAALLSPTQHEVVARVSDGTAAFAAMNEVRPDIAVLDARMPGMSGIEVVERIANTENAPRIVVLTADLEDDDLISLMALGVEGIVFKNGGEHMLIDCLDRIAAGGRWISRELLNRHARLVEDRARSPLNDLTKRERDIADLVRQGLRNRAIGEELGLSEGTVKVYLNRIYEKLAIASRTELVLILTASSSGAR